MPRWTYTLTITNGLKRNLLVEPPNIIWGQCDKERPFPEVIKPNESTNLYVYSPPARSYGLEFSVTLKDQAPANQPMYGTIFIRVDMPYWKHDNSSECMCSGILSQSGFKKVPHGNHDFETHMIVSLKEGFTED